MTISAQELDRITAWMQTPEFKRRVEAARQRYHDGEPVNLPALAQELEVPLPMLSAVFMRRAMQAAGMVPEGRPQ